MRIFEDKMKKLFNNNENIITRLDTVKNNLIILYINNLLRNVKDIFSSRLFDILKLGILSSDSFLSKKHYGTIIPSKDDDGTNTVKLILSEETMKISKKDIKTIPNKKLIYFNSDENKILPGKGLSLDFKIIDDSVGRLLSKDYELPHLYLFNKKNELKNADSVRFLYYKLNNKWNFNENIPCNVDIKVSQKTGHMNIKDLRINPDLEYGYIGIHNIIKFSNDYYPIRLGLSTSKNLFKSFLSSLYFLLDYHNISSIRKTNQETGNIEDDIENLKLLVENKLNINLFFIGNEGDVYRSNIGNKRKERNNYFIYWYKKKFIEPIIFLDLKSYSELNKTVALSDEKIKELKKNKNSVSAYINNNYYQPNNSLENSIKTILSHLDSIIPKFREEIDNGSLLKKISELDFKDETKLAEYLKLDNKSTLNELVILLAQMFFIYFGNSNLIPFMNSHFIRQDIWYNKIYSIISYNLAFLIKTYHIPSSKDKIPLNKLQQINNKFINYNLLDINKELPIVKIKDNDYLLGNIYLEEENIEYRNIYHTTGEIYGRILNKKLLFDTETQIDVCLVE